jgi:hypothetical protein
MNEVHAFPYHFFMIHVYVTLLSSTPGSSKWSLSSVFTHQNPRMRNSLNGDKWGVNVDWSMIITTAYPLVEVTTLTELPGRRHLTVTRFDE